MGTTKPQIVAPEKRKWTMVELAAAISQEFRGPGEKPMHVDTLVKARRKRTTKAITAAQLEKVTGIDRRKFLWPEEFGDPWKLIVGNGNGKH